MQGPKAVFEAHEQGQSSDLLLLVRPAGEDWLGGFEVDIAQLVLPEVMEGVGGLSEGILVETRVDFQEELVELAKYPAVEEVLFD